jgi:hypothetical protein
MAARARWALLLKRRDAMNRRSLLMMVGFASIAGCARWDFGGGEQNLLRLPTPRMSPNTVVLELTFARYNPEQSQDIGELWQEADEQVLPSDLRHRLNVNGIRCGVIGSQLPPIVQRLLDQPSDAMDPTTTNPEQLADDVTRRQHRLQSREGVRTPIAASNNVDKLDVLINEDGICRGETFKQAQCMLAVRTTPHGDGRAQLEVTPEIEHGQPRNRPVGQEGFWKFDFSRDRKTFDSLRMNVVLSPGQVLVISSNMQQVGLGHSFFDKGPQQSTMLLIRLAQTQKDELFEGNQSAPE